MHSELAREFVAAASRFDGIDVADKIGDGDVGRRKFFHVALVGGQVRDRNFVAETRHFLTAAAADGIVRIVANFTASEVWHLRIEQCGKGSQEAAFGLAAQTKQNKVVARENGVYDLRYYRIVIADDARENAGVVVIAQARHQVFAQFVFHAASAQTFSRKGTAAQFAKGARKTHEGTPEKNTCLDYTRKGGLGASATGPRGNLSIRTRAVYKGRSRKPEADATARGRCPQLARARAPRGEGWGSEFRDRR